MVGVGVDSYHGWMKVGGGIFWVDGGGWASFIVWWGVCGGRWRYILSG